MFDLIALTHEYGREFPETLSKFMNDPANVKFWWAKGSDNAMLKRSYGNVVPLSRTNGHFDVQDAYKGLAGSGNKLEHRFNYVFAEMGVESKLQLHFEYLSASAFGLSLIAGAWRLPKELKASFVLYTAMDVLQLLHLAIARSLLREEQGTDLEKIDSTKALLCV